jgi:hypothetical protein
MRKYSSRSGLKRELSDSSQAARAEGGDFDPRRGFRSRTPGSIDEKQQEKDIRPTGLSAENKDARRWRQSQDHPAAMMQKWRLHGALAAERRYWKKGSIFANPSWRRAEPENPLREKQTADLPHRQHFSVRNSEGLHVRLRALRTSEDEEEKQMLKTREQISIEI